MEEGTPPKRPKLDNEGLENRQEGADSQPDNVDGPRVEEPTDNEDALLEEELREAQYHLDVKHEEMLDKMREVEAEYNKLKQPLYAARGKIIRRIPGFWLHCFLQHEEIKSILGTVDHDILVNLDEVRVEPFAQPETGYRIVFVFSENPYFEEEELSKEVHFEEVEMGPELLVCRVTGCQPTWKDESAALLEGEDGEESMAFFRWFLEENEVEGGMVDTVADIIKDQLFVNPLTFMDPSGPDQEYDDLLPLPQYGNEEVVDLEPDTEGDDLADEEGAGEGVDDGSAYDEPGDPGGEGIEDRRGEGEEEDDDGLTYDDVYEDDVGGGDSEALGLD